MIGSRTPCTSMTRRLVSTCQQGIQSATAKPSRANPTKRISCAETAIVNPGRGAWNQTINAANKAAKTSHGKASPSGRQTEGLVARITISPPSSMPPGRDAHVTVSFAVRGGASAEAAAMTAVEETAQRRRLTGAGRILVCAWNHMAHLSASALRHMSNFGEFERPARPLPALGNKRRLRRWPRTHNTRPLYPIGRFCTILASNRPYAIQFNN
jgi:hypothetical protein